jgi:hypothetical protein
MCFGPEAPCAGSSWEKSLWGLSVPGGSPLRTRRRDHYGERVQDRREFLQQTAKVSLALGLLGDRAQAIGKTSELSIGVIRHGGQWDHRPEAVRRLLWETGKRTSIQVARERTVVSLDDDGSEEARALYWQPLLVLTGEGPMPPWTKAARARLERHLRQGGMLVVDAPSPSDPFLVDAERELDAVLPSLSRRRLPGDHVVMKSFFLIPRAEGRLRLDENLEGMDLGNRAAVVVSKNDLLGAFERDRFGTWRFECEPDGDAQRERAFRLGVNLVMLATCLDYKEDQVHIPFIMKKKRR